MAEAILPSLQILLEVRRQLQHASIYEEEVGLLNSIIGDFDAFLKKANSMETIDDVSTKNSKKLAWELIYDSQDAIDDLMQQKWNRWLGRLLPDLDKLFRRRRFVSRANEIKRKLKNHSERRKQIDDLLPQVPARHPNSSPDGHLHIAFLEDDNQLEGIDDAKDCLVRRLTQEDNPKVIFVHGAQGVGKTSLVAAVLRNEEVKERFKYCVWIEDLEFRNAMEASRKAVEASRNAVEVNVDIWDLTTKFNERVSSQVAFQRMKNDADLSEQTKRWLLVLDDASRQLLDRFSVNHLDPTSHECPSVLITTRDSSLESCAKQIAPASSISAATQGVNSSGPHNLNGFLSFKHVSISMNHSLQLLRRKMLIIDASPDVLSNASQSILDTCEGLPLAILATFHLLEYNLNVRNGTHESVIWKRVSGRLGEELLSRRHNNYFISRMTTLPMDQLHDVSACLFYFSVFPLYCPIRCSTLMRLWMAERFDRRMDPAIADENLRKLLGNNFIQEVEETSYGRARTCRIHNLLHEIIMKMSKDDEFAMVVGDREEEWPETIRRLSFHRSLHKSASANVSSETSNKKDECQIEKHGKKFRRLHSLLVFGEVCPEFMEKLLEQVHRLKVLHLEASSLNNFPKGIPRLKYLRYLKLSGTHVNTIPEDIRHLVHLETLDLKGTCVRELPDGILELKALCHLLVYTSVKSPDAVEPNFGVKAPSALGDLKSLQKLCMIELNPVEPNKLRGKCGKRKHKRVKPDELLQELGKLTSLQRLGISMLTNEKVELLCSSIKKLIKLEALRLIAAPDETLDLSQRWTAPECLQRVHLTGRFKNLSDWLHSPERLVKLVLKMSQLTGGALQNLGRLQGLKHLELQQASDVREMNFEQHWFPNLRFLSLDTIDRLDSIIVQENALPTLEILSLARCRSLKTVPQDIARPRELKRLELYGMHKEFINKVFEFITAVERNEEVRKHIKVNFKDWIDGAIELVMPFPAHGAGNPPDPPPL